MFLWFSLEDAAGFRDTYGVRRDVKSYRDLAAEMNGSKEHKVKINGNAIRGVTVRLDHLPLNIVREVICLVNIHCCKSKNREG